MLSPNIETALNEQIAIEAAASQKYLAMACWCDSQALEGSAAFFFQQSEEERMHMMKIVNYVLESGGSVTIPALEKPKADYLNIREVVDTAYASEKFVTKSIHKLVNLALSESDHGTNNFLQWYVAEQQEEEALMRKLQDKITLIGDGGQSLYYIDKAINQTGKEAAAAEQA